MKQQKTAQRIGKQGELYAKRKIERLGADVLYTADLDVGYDLLVNDTLKIEIKTARKNKRGQYQFCLNKLDHANVNKADILILQCVVDLGYIVSYTLPVSELGGRNQITLPGNLEIYNGFFAEYKD